MGTKLVKCKKNPNLFREEKSGIYHFRKYSSVKRKQFFRSTGERESEAAAYKKGLELFNEWIGRDSDESGVIYFSRVAKRHLIMKLADPSLRKRTKQTLKSMYELPERGSGRKNEKERPRLIEAFGHLPIDKIDNEIWVEWINEIRLEFPKFKFFNTRKALNEVLHYGVGKGYRKSVPKLINPDGKAAPPRALTRDELRLLFRSAYGIEMVRGPKRTIVPRRRADGIGFVRYRGLIKLLMFIFWKQGARPGEILQYEWAMIHFEEGSHGRIHIPGRITKTGRDRIIPLNPKVARLLRFLRPRSKSPFLFPSPDYPDRPMSSYNKAWEGVCKRAQFDAQLYWFRDTFVTQKINEGHKLIWIADYIDSSAQMLDERYAAASDETLEDIAK